MSYPLPPTPAQRRDPDALGPGIPGLVSIIIPTYNRVPEVLLAAQSALAQTYPHIEVLVIADGPDRKARVAVEALAATDSRLRYIELAVNSGPAEARNVGVGLSRGQWLAFLDDDDTMLPRKTELQMALTDLKDPRRMISCRTIYRHDGRDDIWPARSIHLGEDVSDYILRRPSLFARPGVLPIQTLLVHRSIVAEIPFTTHKDHEDWAWLLEACHYAGAYVVFAWEPLVVYNIVTDSISRSRRMNWRESLEWADRYRAWIGNPAYNSFLATKVAFKAKRAGNWSGLRSIAKIIVRNRPAPLDLLFLAGTAMLPLSFLHFAWKSSLKNETGRPVGALPQ